MKFKHIFFALFTIASVLTIIICGEKLKVTKNYYGSEIEPNPTAIIG